jgi:hypothetical protein
MSFNTLKYFSLQKAARIMAVDITNCKSKEEILNKFDSYGITYEDYEKALAETGSSEDAVKKPAKPVSILDETKSDIVSPKSNEKMLVTMAIMRGVYKVKHYYFELEKPFLLIDKDEAISIIANSRGNLREASPKEVADYYGIMK